jgi:hypothetical protein
LGEERSDLIDRPSPDHYTPEQASITGSELMRAIRTALALLLGLTVVASLAVRADTRAGKKAAPKAFKGDPAVVFGDSATRQAALKRSFEILRNRLSTLAARMEATGLDPDKKKAEIIRKALKAASDLGTEAKFESLVRGLSTPGADKKLDELRAIIKDNKELRDDLKKLIAILNEDDSAKRLAEKNKKTEDVIKQLKELRDRQARLQAKTEMGKSDTKKIGTEQDKLTKDTKDVTESKTDEDGKPQGLDQIENKETAEKARKHVDQAVMNQKAAQGKLGKGNKDGAGDSQGAAVKNLDDAINVLEEELRQGRKEERERKLKDLLARAKRMLTMQTDVQGELEKLDQDIRRAGKPALTHAARSNKLSDKEREIVKESEGAVKLIKSEGENSAVAFGEIFDQLTLDTATIMERLGQTDTGKVTQKITDDVIETLKDVIKALEKELKDNENEPNQPRPPTDSDPNRKQPLVNLLQELKMVFAMQKRVNDRTTLYGKTYTGEQAPQVVAGLNDADKKRVERIVKEMKSLSDRQDRISKVTKEISKKPEAQRLGQ